MHKQLNLIYFSATGITAKIVKAVAGGMGGSVRENDITLPGEREKGLTFGRDDLVIVGVPVHGGRVPALLADYFTRVKGNNTPAVFMVVYGNRNYDDALLELKSILEENGFIGVAGGAFIGEHAFTNLVGTGRPSQKDLAAARGFGAQIKEKLSMVKDGDLSKLPGLLVKGNYPYKERKPKTAAPPQTNELCKNCGTCAENCPVGAIDFSNYSNVDAEKCIGCCRCVKRCPVGAKFMNSEPFKKIARFLIDNCGTVEKEQELFV